MPKASALAFSVIFFVSALAGTTAQAADYLSNAFDVGLITTQTVVAYDTCVNQGFIKDSGPSGQEKFQATIEKIKTIQQAPGMPTDITGTQVAATMQKAFDLGRQAYQKQPIQIDQEKCADLEKAWPEFSQIHGFE